MSLWGWESAKKAGKSHLYLEVAGIIFLALLVLFEALEETETTFAQAFKRAGTWALAALVVAEIARMIYGVRADKLTERDAEAKLQAAQNDIAALNARLADRSLTPERQQAFVSALSPFSGMLADIVTYEATYEVMETANLIMTLTRKAGWEINQFVSLGTASARGILVATDPNNDFPNAGAAADALLGVIAAQGWPSQRIAYNTVMKPGTQMTLRSSDGIRSVGPILVVIGARL